MLHARAEQTNPAKPLTVLLLDGQSTFALPVIRCLSAMPGTRIHVLATSNLLPVRASRAVASFRCWNGLDQPGGAEFCAAYAREVGADVCLAVDIPTIEAAALNPGPRAVAFTPIPPLASLRIACDKWDFARFVQSRALPHPESLLCVDSDSGRAELRDLVFPVLIKPRSGGNGAGIRRFDDADALLRHLAAHPDLWGNTIAQHLIAGHDIDCSVLCVDGRVIAHTIQRGFTSTVGYKPPGGIEFTHHQKVLDIAQALVAELQWTGVAHIDLRTHADSGDVSLIEVNPRFWGSVLGSEHAGVNFPHLACLAGLARTFDYPQSRACRFVAGNTAARIWRQGHFGSKIAGFTIADTVFRYMLSDPLSSALEWFLS